VDKIKKGSIQKVQPDLLEKLNILMRMSRKDWLEKHVSTYNRKQKMRVAIPWDRAERHRESMQESEVEWALKQSLANKASSMRAHDGVSP
jgi:hypothetical protein